MPIKFQRIAGSTFLMSLAFACAAPVWAQNNDAEAAETIRQLEIFAEVFAAVRENYVEEVDDGDLIENALNGALETLDPHSHFVPPQIFEDRQKSARREYGGLGIEVVQENGLVKVNYVISDGPAGLAGIKKGDFITAVEGESVIGKSLDQAVEGMRGLAGDPIKISVQSPDEYSREVTVIRQQVQGRAVRHRMEDGVGYIYIETFNHPRLSRDVKEAVEDLIATSGTLPGLIIDVRGNPGGLVDQVVGVTGLFLDGGEVFSARGRTIDNTQRYNADKDQIIPEDTPIAVLINSRSASAAEIIAGAIQDRGRGIVVGRRSFGKGSVQSVMPLDDGSALRLTTQRYYTPSGKSIQGRGILPDVLVARRPDDGENRKFFREDSLPNSLTNPDDTDYEEDPDLVQYPPADWPLNEDYQLHRAVELVKSPRYETLLLNQDWQ